MDIFDQFFALVSQNAGAGAQGAGRVADFIVRAGLTASEISQLLQGVSERAAYSPDLIAYAQAEAQRAQTFYAEQHRNNWLIPLAIGAVVLFAVNSRNNR